jgi:chloramphenicol-sensitive protein RarD
MNKGLIFGMLAFLFWGSFPIYWRGLHAVPAMEILAYRITGSLIFVLALLLISKNTKWIKSLTLKEVGYYGITSIFISINWLVYIWAVNHDQVVEASLGYYINPLVNVLLAEIFLKERLRSVQRIAIIIACCGVAYLTYKYGQLPWVSVVLAFSFAFYGLLKKKAKLGGIESFSLESLILSIPATIYIIYLFITGSSSFGAFGSKADLLLLGAGVATGLPLIFYNLAAKKITLTTIGMLQYFSPTLQLLIGVFVFKEAFPMDKILGFIIIWLALVIYTAELISFNRKKKLN